MMNCLTTRRVLLADPTESNAELTQHLASCPSCRAFARKLTDGEAFLRSAMEIPVPDQLQERILLQTALQRRSTNFFSRLSESFRALAMPQKAGLAVAFSAVMAVGIWYYQPRHDANLNWSEVVLAHVIGEPGAVASTESLPRATLAKALNKYGLALKGELGAIRFVEHCVVPGGRGTHIVIDTHRLGKVSLILPPAGMRAASSSARGDGYTAKMVDIVGVSVGVVTSDPGKLHALTDLLGTSLVRQG